MKKLFSLILICMLLVCGCTKEEKAVENSQKDPEPVVETRKYIVDSKSQTRPIAVMINNHPTARPYHSGLQDAFLVYEMLVEGGISRMMAIFKDQTTERIGSVRSARHTYLDYVLENDALYVHFGWSYIAEDQIPKLGINNINFLYSNGYWRDKSLGIPTEHTAFTSIEKINEQVVNKNYRNTSTQKLLLDYSLDEIDISKKSSAERADKVSLRFSSSNTTSFVYDQEAKVYNRFVNDKAHTDYVTKKQFTTKNIIVTKIRNYSVDNSILQELDNITTGAGYYITDGYAAPIKWSKSSRGAQTVYTYLDGNEIKVNNGNTYIEIVPLTDNSVTISANEVAQTE